MNVPAGPARIHFLQIICITAFSLVVAACAGLSDNLLSRQSASPLYRPPTSAVNTLQPALTSTLAARRIVTQTPVPPIPTPTCANNLTFVEDLTIPDGSLVQPGEALDKRWMVENSGTCNWESSYRLKLIAGPSMGIDAEQALYPARSGTQASIRLVFTAPAEANAYRSAWQAYAPDGSTFGDPIFIDVVVTSSDSQP